MRIQRERGLWAARSQENDAALLTSIESGTCANAAAGRAPQGVQAEGQSAPREPLTQAARSRSMHRRPCHVQRSPDLLPSPTSGAPSTSGAPGAPCSVLSAEMQLESTESAVCAQLSSNARYMAQRLSFCRTQRHTSAGRRNRAQHKRLGDSPAPGRAVRVMHVLPWFCFCCCKQPNLAGLKQ